MFNVNLELLTWKNNPWQQCKRSPWSDPPLLYWHLLFTRVCLRALIKNHKQLHSFLKEHSTIFKNNSNFRRNDITQRLKVVPS